MKNQISLSEQIGNFIAGNYAIVTTENAADLGWTEFACRTASLARKTKRSYNQLKIVSGNLGINIADHYATLKNIEPVEGKLYDVIEIRTLAESELVLTIVPKSGISGSDNNGFVIKGKSKKKSFEGKWSAIKDYFAEKNPNDKELTLRRNLPGCPKDTKFEKHGKVYKNTISQEEGTTDKEYSFSIADIENHKKWFSSQKEEFVTVAAIYTVAEVAKANLESESSDEESTEENTSDSVEATIVEKPKVEKAKSAADAIAEIATTK